jgi:hypothetical protein
MHHNLNLAVRVGVTQLVQLLRSEFPGPGPGRPGFTGIWGPASAARNRTLACMHDAAVLYKKKDLGIPQPNHQSTEDL